MKYVSINERAAAQAMTFVVGDQARACIENLYTIIDTAMQDAYVEGYTQAQDTAAYVAKQPAFEPVFADDEAVDLDYGVDSGDVCTCESCQAIGQRMAQAPLSQRLS